MTEKGAPDSWAEDEQKAASRESAVRNQTRAREQRKSARRWVSVKFLSEYFSVSTVTIWTWTREGKLPQPVRFSANATRWDLDEIEKAIEAA